ncbi:hypothetical protein NLJ89_g10777 [Agrocybe chaxingu]|uniref:Uncharacterized protein n=1 Tax=Agrocybe chaxingu TaxID=84603 RepID=A0A9W8JN78_9AGAR|nr:hypothetical protein NLJ89_g10777 [Agrocybe chaxingu]
MLNVDSVFFQTAHGRNRATAYMRWDEQANVLNDESIVPSRRKLTRFTTLRKAGSLWVALTPTTTGHQDATPNNSKDKEQTPTQSLFSFQKEPLRAPLQQSLALAPLYTP